MVKKLRAMRWQKPRVRTLLVKAPLVLMGWFVALVLLIAVIFSMPATRGLILNKGLAIAGNYLPGELSWTEANWTGIGELKFENVQWKSSAEQGSIVLADITLLELEVDISAIRQKDIRLHRLDLNLGFADVPAIMKVLELPLSPDSSQTKSTELEPPASFPRPGSVPGLPSLALEMGMFSAAKIVLPDGSEISNLVMNLELEGGTGRLPQLEVKKLAASLSLSLPDSAVKPLVVNIDHTGLQVRMLNDSISGLMDCSFTLPGGEYWQPYIPEGVPGQLVELVQPPVLGDLSIHGQFKDDLLNANLELDLEKTLWLDQALVCLKLASPKDFTLENMAATLDTFNVALLGSQVQASAEMVNQTLNWQLELDVADASLPLLFAGESMQGSDLQFNVHGQGKGTFIDPQIDVNFGGSIASVDITIPNLQGSIKGGRSSLISSLNVEGPIVAGGFLADSLQLDLHSNISNPDSLETSFGLNVWAPDLLASVNGKASRDTIQKVQLDSLIIYASDVEMRSTQVSTIRLGPKASDFQVDNFLLSGEPGSININAYRNATGLAINSGVNLFLSEEILQTFAPSTFWSQDGGRDISINGLLEFGGTSEGPDFQGSLNTKLIPHRDEQILGLGVDLFLENGSSSQAGLGAGFSISLADSIIFTGEARLPGHFDITDGSWHTATNQFITIEVPEQLLALRLLNNMLPSEVKLHGDLNFAADVKIPSESAEGMDGEVSGLVFLEKVRVDLPNRSRVEIGLDLALEGSVSDPLVAGTIELHSGFFRIPELPKALHPAEGTSLLWEAVKKDTLITPGADLQLWKQAAVADSLLNLKQQILLPEMDVLIRIPGNMRVHGYGLDVELGGELNVKRGEDAAGIPTPIITGSVDVLEGTLRFMNRMFISQKGEIQFAGLAPADPILDLKLEAEIDSYVIKLEVSGPATDPIIELTSEPQMNEVDIMAVLFFGQPANDLDNDQRGHMNEETDPGQQLRENLAGLAMVFGTAGISTSMSNTLGVDMLEVGSDSDGDSTIMVGKFLTPKIMLKYHQSLEKSGSNFMTIEYSLSRFLKLMSSYGQGDEPSGLELGFTRRY